MEGGGGRVSTVNRGHRNAQKMDEKPHHREFVMLTEWAQLLSCCYLFLFFMLF